MNTTRFAGLLLMLVIAPLCAAQEYPVAPQEEHRRLQANVGTWDADISVWAQGPDADPLKSKGVERVVMFGELWILTDLEFDFMGAPTQGHGTTGYDPSKKKYVGTWQESGSPYLSTMEGQYDPATKKFTYLMNSKDPAGNDQQMKIVSWNTDATHRTFELYAKAPDSDEYIRAVEIVYTKR